MIHFADQLKTALWPTARQSHRDRKIQVNHEQIGGILAESIGETSIGSSAPTGKAGPSFAEYQLAFTSWLMGYPLDYLAAWVPDSSPRSATPSSGRSRPKSSKR